MYENDCIKELLQKFDIKPTNKVNVVYYLLVNFLIRELRSFPIENAKENAQSPLIYQNQVIIQRLDGENSQTRDNQLQRKISMQTKLPS